MAQRLKGRREALLNSHGDESAVGLGVLHDWPVVWPFTEPKPRVETGRGRDFSTPASQATLKPPLAAGAARWHFVTKASPPSNPMVLCANSPTDTIAETAGRQLHG